MRRQAIVIATRPSINAVGGLGAERRRSPPGWTSEPMLRVPRRSGPWGGSLSPLGVRGAARRRASPAARPRLTASGKGCLFRRGLVGCRRGRADHRQRAGPPWSRGASGTAGLARPSEAVRRCDRSHLRVMLESDRRARGVSGGHPAWTGGTPRAAPASAAQVHRRHGTVVAWPAIGQVTEREEQEADDERS